MASLIDRVHSAMLKLGQRPWSEDSSIFLHMKNFENEIDFMARFVDCIRFQSNALELAPHLVSVVKKVEASLENIGGEFLERMNREKRTFMFRFMSAEDKFSEKTASKWISVLQNWVDEMVDLKPEVSNALESLSINSVNCKISVVDDFKKWKKIIISTYKHVEDVQGFLIAHSHRPSDHSGCSADPYLEKLLSNLEYDDIIKDSKVEALLTRFGNSIISAELLCCQWWLSAADRDLLTGKEVIKAAFEDLDGMIWVTNPEFVDVLLTVLKATSDERFGTITNLVVHRYMPSYKYRAVRVFCRELISLVDCILRMKDDTMMVKMFLPITKQLLKETASIPKYSDNRYRHIAWNLTENIWLIKIEILLRTQINGNKNKVNKKNYSMKRIVHVIKESSTDSVSPWFTARTEMILTFIEEVEKEAPKFPKSTTTTVVRSLLFRTLLVRGELMFLKLPDNLLGSFKDSIESLHEGFKLMMPPFINQGKDLEFNCRKTGFAVVESLASRIIALYQQILVQQNTSEEMLTSSLPDLLDEIKLIMNELKSCCVQMPVFPYTNAVGFSHSLQDKLQELLNHKMDLVESIITKKQMSEIIELLEFSRPFLQDPLDHTMPQELKDLFIRALNLTYETEYVIDSVISRGQADARNTIWVYHLLQETRDLKKKLSQNQVKRTSKLKVHMISRETTPEIAEGVVSLVDEEQSIIDRIVGGIGKLNCVSIVGMPGIGKTTLAKKVYNSPQVVTHFWNRAWCCVSEVYRRRDVLLEILSHMIPITTDIMGMADADLEFKLYQILMTGRYLIVLDDVWDIDVLDDVVRRFPDKENNSRLLITSRDDRVALKANRDDDPHRLRKLYDDECWKLLQMKVFHGEPCPDELKKIGEEIAASCKGLPLAVIAIAGLLQRIERQHNHWKDIAERLTSKIVDDPQEQWRRILELSYENLPDCLKACFLYFGGFPEDQDIPALKVMQLWIAEGFVPKTDLKTMEDVAEDYLMDLISRSLIMLSKQSSLGGAKACRIHDVLRKFCQSKAKEDNFLQVITMSDASSKATLHDLDYEFSANFENPTNSSVTHEEHHLCFCSKRKHFIYSRPFGPHVRSLLCFANGDEDPKYPYDISFISQNFEFLKVLDLECINMGTSFAEDILLLVQLKYLAISGYIHSIPSSIAKLWNLETFIVKGF